MPKLYRVSGESVINALEKLGFCKARQRGSHVVLKKKTDEGEIGCVVPLHKELAIGTLRGILRQIKVSTEEFISKLK
jgi:predicted RNA binding protein YcfA (HicA-like mRNA interferase family)